MIVIHVFIIIMFYAANIILAGKITHHWWSNHPSLPEKHQSLLAESSLWIQSYLLRKWDWGMNWGLIADLYPLKRWDWIHKDAISI